MDIDIKESSVIPSFGVYVAWELTNSANVKLAALLGNVANLYLRGKQDELTSEIGKLWKLVGQDEAFQRKYRHHLKHDSFIPPTVRPARTQSPPNVPLCKGASTIPKCDELSSISKKDTGKEERAAMEGEKLSLNASPSILGVKRAAGSSPERKGYPGSPSKRAALGLMDTETMRRAALAAAGITQIDRVVLDRKLDADQVVERKTISEEEFIKIFLQHLHFLEQRYLSRHWDVVSALVEANAEHITADRKCDPANDSEGKKNALVTEKEERQKRMCKEKKEENEKKNTTAFEISHPDQDENKESDEIHPFSSYALDSKKLTSTLKKNRISFVMFCAPYCPYCHNSEPEFCKAAQMIGKAVSFYAVDCSEDQVVKEKYAVIGYPTFVLFEREREVSRFPGVAKRDAATFVQFVQNNGQLRGRLRARDRWRGVFARLRARRALRLLHVQRQFVTMIEMYRSLGIRSAGDLGPDDSPMHHSMRANSPPTAYFIGGGMGCGKTTVINVLSRTLWHDQREHMVIVSADDMKLIDPVYKSLPDGSRLVHQRSSQVADELLLAALERQRDVIIDATMSWHEYVLQSVSTVANIHAYTYRRGRGYCELEDGSILEEYFIREGKRLASHGRRKYRIVLIGVTAPAHVSVMRGIVRKLVTGRSVGITSQLRSHKLFSENFERYVEAKEEDHSLFFDEVRLYSNESEEGEPRLIYLKKGDVVLSCVPNAYRSFLNKKYIQTQATSVFDLYPENHCLSAWNDKIKHLNGVGPHKKLVDDWLQSANRVLREKEESQ